MAVSPQGPYSVLKRFVAVKAPGKKEGSLDVVFLQCFDDKSATIRKFVAGKNQCYFFLRGIAAGDGPFYISVILIYFFFTPPLASASLAANR